MVGMAGLFGPDLTASLVPLSQPSSLCLLCSVHLSQPSPFSASIRALSASVCFVWSICLSPLSLSLLCLVHLSQPSQPQFASFGPSVLNLSASVSFCPLSQPSQPQLALFSSSVPALSASFGFICQDLLMLAGSLAPESVSPSHH